MTNQPSPYQSMPAWRFILQYGVLGWGVTTALLWSVIMAVFTGGTRSFTGVAERFGEHILPALVIFPLLGILFGAALLYLLRRVLPETDD